MSDRPRQAAVAEIMTVAVETDLLARRALLLRFGRQAKRAEARDRLFGVARRAGRRRQRRRMSGATQQALAGDRTGAAETFRRASGGGDGIEAEPASDDVLRVLGAVRAPRLALAGLVRRSPLRAAMKARLLLIGGTRAAGA
jgi:hypothetical protein